MKNHQFHSEYKDYNVASIELALDNGRSGQVWVESVASNSVTLGIWDRKRIAQYHEISSNTSETQLFEALETMVADYFSDQ